MTTLEDLAVALVVGSGAFIVGYYLLVNLGYLLIHVLALFELRDSVRESEWNPPFRPFDSPFYPGVAMVVPAYNEAATIVESVRSMLALNYPDQEVVVVNDGSTDATMDRLREAFELERIDAALPYDVPAEPIRGVYRSTRHEDLFVVDKENGGKSDALNAGLWLTDQQLFCAVDSDTVIDRNALLQIVRPFLEEPEKAVASGGTIRVANDCVVEDGEVQEINLPRTGLPGIQVMEYLRAFYSGRLGLSRLKGLVLISGAFGVFRTDRVREIGGYRHDTVTEDFDVVVRLHRYLSDEDVEYTVDFLPEPVAWTEVPSDLRTLGRQRRRWYRGMLETVVANRGVFFRRRYGRVGTAILPFFTAAEALGPLIEGFGYVLLPLAWYFGILNVEFFLVFLLLTVGVGVFLSWFGVFSEVWSFNRYEDPKDVLRLLWYGVLENFGYRQWKTAVAWHGLVEFLRGEKSWGAMERRGFGGAGTPAAAADPPDVTASTAAGADDPDGGFAWIDRFADDLPDGDPIDAAGFAWIDELVEEPGTDGIRWISRIAGVETESSAAVSSSVETESSAAESPAGIVGATAGGFLRTPDPGAGLDDGGFVRTDDFTEGVGNGGFVWTTDPSEGAGDGGFVLLFGADDDPASGRIVATTDFSLGVGDGGFVWTTDPSDGVGDGGFVWTREFDDGEGREGYVWMVDGTGPADGGVEPVDSGVDPPDHADD
ncbi:glycosyltransferase family 2 protein [Halorubrum aquaticum]|nr:glycosyltransferase [Halorubrum aquaticum]